MTQRRRSYTLGKPQLRDVRDNPRRSGTDCTNFFCISTLCAMQTTLEPADAFTRNYTHERAQGEHVCID